MADFFGIANAYRDAVGQSAQPRTGSDELERTKGEARAIAQGKRDQAARFALDAAMNLRDSMVGYGGGVKAGPTANYRALGTGATAAMGAQLGAGRIGGTPEANRLLGQQLAAQRGWTGAQWDALNRLIMKESGWRHDANNPTSSAYGIGQALAAMHKLPAGYYDSATGKGASAQYSGGDPRVQILWALDYIANRYGDPTRALQFHLKNNWY